MDGLANDVDAFIAGTPRVHLPRLRRLAGGLSNIRTNEQSIEGRMSVLGSVFKNFFIETIRRQIGVAEFDFQTPEV